jgi:hypothetical protein
MNYAKRVLVTHFSIASGDELKHRDSRRDKISFAKVSRYICVLFGCTCSIIILNKMSSRNVSSPSLWTATGEHTSMTRNLGKDNMSSLNRSSNTARELS